MVFLQKRGGISEEVHTVGRGTRKRKGENQGDERRKRTNTPPLRWKTAVGIETGDD